MKRYEALMIGPNGATFRAVAYGETLMDAENMAAEGVAGMDGWTVVLSGDYYNEEN